MKRAAWSVWTLAGWLVASAASAQVELTWKLAHNRTVLLEPIRATVAIVNNTGQTLDLTPRGNAQLFFDVEDQPTSPVPATSAEPESPGASPAESRNTSRTVWSWS